MPACRQHTIVLCLIFSSFLADSVADESGSRTVTEADMPRIPHTEPNEALATFRLASGFTLELVAAEPLVSDPVAACFDEFGRMFVAEMHGYPFSQEPTKLNPDGGGLSNAGIIRLLEDTDNDGTADRSTVFADGISWPTSVCCYNGGIFVIAPQYLYYLKDTDGDGVADIREVVLSGFGRDNVQAVTNGLLWGLDNHIYFAAGRNPANLQHRGQPLLNVSGADLRFDPRTEVFETVTGGLQFGHSQDDWGTRFVCSNSDHIQQVIYPRGYVSRNPFLAVSGMVRSIAADGASARVFRRSPPEPWRIVRQKWRAADKGYHLVINADGGWEFIPMDPSKKAGVVPTEYPVGFFTSATGITIYRGDAYPKEFRGNAFVGDVGGNLVHRKIVETEHITYSAKRADEGEELIASSDNWFRPVNFVNAPDGCLYVLDMYRETIEHPYSIPQEIKNFLDLTSGRDRGRIYRLVSPNAQRYPPRRLGDLTTEQLVAELASDNGWNRDTAQRLLWERQDRTVVPAIEHLLKSTDKPLGRLHALCTLQGLDALTSESLQAGLQDPHPRVRAQAVRLTESFLRESEEPLEWLAPLCRDPNEHVRFQLAFTLGESAHDKAVELLSGLAADSGNSKEIQTAVYSSVGKTADRVLLRLMELPNALEDKHIANVVSELGLMVGANPDPGQSIGLLQMVTSKDQPPRNQQLLITAVGQGLARRGTTVTALLNGPDVPAQLRNDIAEFFENAANSATDDTIELPERLQAVALLAFAEPALTQSRLPELLSSRTPQPLQRAAVRTAGTQNSDDVAEILLSGWRSYSPQVRGDVVEALMARTAGISALLSAVSADTVKRGDVERAVKQQLMSHRDAAIRRRSIELFGSEVDTNRSSVVDSYQDVLQLEGNAERGVAVFQKICASCHKVGNMGHQVAPDLVSVKNKSEADLLLAILDPNREAQPNYNTYAVVTNQGRNYNGIIAAESSGSITLRRAEAKEDVILRSNIDELVATGISLMPEGLEKELSRQQLADVIAFVKSIGAESVSN